jgi:hypothetical protein
MDRLLAFVLTWIAIWLVCRWMVGGSEAPKRRE